MGFTSRPLSRRDQLVVQEHDGEVLIYDLRSNKAFCLNATAALVWQACNGKLEISEIAERISKQLNETASEELVWLALDRLEKEDLIEAEEIPSRFSGLNRREVIKKIGAGSMLALPVIASLIAPTPAHAASSCMSTDFCLCTQPSQKRLGQVCEDVIFTCPSNCACRWSSNGNGDLSGRCGH
jgi:Coenzyme PQQ synthesis protein D (PqqD)